MSVEAFDLSYAGTGFPDHEPAARADLLDRFGAKLGGRWTGTWDTAADRLHARRRPDLPGFVPHPGVDRGAPWHVVPFADGAAFDLMSTSHLLVVGATNAGKSVLLRSLVVALAAKDVDLDLVDPKRTAFVPFRGWPGVRTVATRDEDLHDAALAFNAEVLHRYEAYEDRGVPLESHRPRVLVVDEYEEYAARMKGFAAERRIKQPGSDSPSLAAMASSLRLAREARMHVVIGTQRPDASWFGGAARDNLQGRAFVGRATQDAARMLFGDSTVARDIDPAAKGRTTVQRFTEEPLEVQAWWTPRPDSTDSDDLAILERLR